MKTIAGLGVSLLFTAITVFVIVYAAKAAWKK